MIRTSIIVADSAHARFFALQIPEEPRADGGAHLLEMRDFVNPDADIPERKQSSDARGGHTPRQKAQLTRSTTVASIIVESSGGAGLGAWSTNWITSFGTSDQHDCCLSPSWGSSARSASSSSTNDCGISRLSRSATISRSILFRTSSRF